jgi:signal transduction histidine kinase
MQPEQAPPAAGGAQDLGKSKALLDAVFGNVSVALAILRGPDAVYERINGSFERLAPATHVAGLGLYIVRKIVEAHGGRISAESSPAAGARFVLQLPAEHVAITSRSEAPAS